ncbi:MAG: hypothetical protein WC654_04340 [Patescibacteria group bacterium]
MTPEDFKPQYQRLVEIYGKRTAGHAQEWLDQFRHLTAEEFRAAVTQCIKTFVPFGQDRWPVPAQFAAIPMEPTKPPKTDSELTREWADNYWREHGEE